MKNAYLFLAAVISSFLLASCTDFNTFEVKGRITATTECKGNVLPPYDVTVEIIKGNKKIVNVVATDANGRFGFDFPWIEPKSSPEKWRIVSVYKDSLPICQKPQSCDSANQSCYNHAKNKEYYSMDEAAEYTVMCKCGTVYTIDLFDPFGLKKGYKFGEPGYYYLPPFPKKEDNTDSLKPWIPDETDSLGPYRRWIFPKQD